MKVESLSFRDRFDILLEKRLSGVAELRYTMLYGKSQINKYRGFYNCTILGFSCWWKFMEYKTAKVNKRKVLF